MKLEWLGNVNARVDTIKLMELALPAPSIAIISYSKINVSVYRALHLIPMGNALTERKSRTLRQLENALKIVTIAIVLFNVKHVPSNPFGIKKPVYVYVLKVTKNEMKNV